jgi:Zn-dependent M28 family amino/carboxypeptidase
MFPRVIALAAVLAAASLWPAEIHYRTVLRPVVEARLRAVGKSNAQRHDAVRALFEETGCGDNISEQPVKHSKNPNVICTLPGSADATIIVGAHYDFVDRGAGVIDNWSGVSLLSSLYEGLKALQRKHTFTFIGFTDEEVGLVGSKFYVSRLSKDELAKIRAMVNLDSLGTSTTKFEMDRADKRLANALYGVSVSFKLPLSIVNVHKVGMSDSDSFQDRKVPAIALHSVTQETFPLLHSRGDRMEAIHLDEYYDSYRLIQAYLAYLDEVLE